MKNILKFTYKYDFINPTKTSNPAGAFAPACRGADQLIIYNKDNPYKTQNNLSGVNPYGFEAAINSNGIVVDLNDRVKLPKNGFILSGHGIAHRFLKKNLLLGSKISLEYDNKIVNIETNKYKCLYIEFKTNRQKAINKYNKALKEGYVIDKTKINKLFNTVKEIGFKLSSYNKSKHHSTNDNNKYVRLINKSNKIFEKLYLLTSKSSFIGSRNVWHRPSERNLQEVIDVLDLCKSLNLNGIYLESFYNGDIPGISSITDTNKEVKDCYYGKEYKNDYLLAFISEAHKRNIEVHAWVECYFVGEKSSQWKNTYKDSWHMVNYDGSTIQGNNDEGNEKDFIFLDPANPECMQYVLSIYEELLTKYDFDGINVDYIRYPHGNLNLYSSNGYTDYAMNEFKLLNNLTGDVKELVKDKEILAKWTKYRCDKITLLMQETRKLVNKVKPSCFLSTAVCSELDYAINNKMQNWKVWARKGWLDLTFPMAYYEGCSEVANATKELCDFNKENAFSYTGIMCMLKGQPADLVIKQINTLFENNADGYNLFCLWDVLKRKDVRDNLISSVNKLPSIHPHNNINDVLTMFVKELRSRRNYLPIDKKQTNLLINEIKKLIESDLSLDKLVYKLILLKQTYNHKIFVKEINKLIRYCKVQIKINSKRVA